jgi:hypothetical protein
MKKEEIPKASQDVGILVAGSVKNKKIPKANSRAHIIKRGSGWAIKKEGALRATKIYSSKEEAIKDARKLKSYGLDLIIHKKDGSIEKWEKSNNLYERV